MNQERLKYSTEKYIGPVYFGLLLLNVIGGTIQIAFLQIATKPLLLPLLMLSIGVLVPLSRNRNIILSALFFSFAGDCFLLFEPQWPALFIPGLLCFLVTHILYIIYFFSKKIKEISLIRSFPLLTGLCLLYGAIFLIILFPGLGPLKVPVAIYAVIIMSMLITVFYSLTSFPPRAGQYFISGALLFVLSDSLLAFNKFLVSLHPFAFLIMASYGFAQWFIVKGFLKTAS